MMERKENRVKVELKGKEHDDRLVKKEKQRREEKISNF